MISRQQVVNRLREARYTFKQRAKRVEIWRQKGTAQRVSVSLRDSLDEDYVRIVLRQAGLSEKEIDEFFRACITQQD